MKKFILDRNSQSEFRGKWGRGHWNQCSLMGIIAPEKGIYMTKFF
jgi:hypothetical protein